MRKHVDQILASSWRELSEKRKVKIAALEKIEN